MSLYVILLSLLAVVLVSASSPSSGSGLTSLSASGDTAVVRFASPLQSLTIFDEPAKPSPRSKFLQKYRAGLQAEVKAHQLVEKERESQSFEETYGEEWAEQAAAAERRWKQKEDRIVEKAYDQAVARFQDDASADSSSPRAQNEYQFVGVVNRPTVEKPITWYARKKPANAKWSVRLVHVNRNAIIKDLFCRGKVDVCGKYANTGKMVEQTKAPIIEGTYSVKERSWRTLWNFGPKRFFADSSGMYWRERRLRPGLYTDGSTVYEASYRYGDGRNGMRRVSPLQVFMDSKSVSDDIKTDIARRLKEGSPDVVLEK